eukprot:CFRG4990T1
MTTVVDWTGPYSGPPHYIEEYTTGNTLSVEISPTIKEFRVDFGLTSDDEEDDRVSQLVENFKSDAARMSSIGWLKTYRFYMLLWNILSNTSCSSVILYNG